MSDEFPIEWITESVGVIYDNQPCTQRTHWQIRLSSGKVAQVATVQFTINPFPRHGDCAYSGGERVSTNRPKIDLPSEERAYCEALIFAGRWLESATSKAKENFRKP